MSKKKLFIRTYGCQMNVYDSERMSEALGALDYDLCATPEDADMVLLNTCHIREKASEKTFSELGRLRLLKAAKAAEGKNMIVAVAGCVAQAEGEEILRRAPYVDLVIGPQAYHRLPDMVAQVAKTRAGSRGKLGAGVLDTEFPTETKFDHLKAPRRATQSSAFLTVQEGCDKFCTFCVVPYTRGAEYSRPVEKIVAEARQLIATGASELTLLGQNVNAYHGEGADGNDCSLAGLIARLADLDGLYRIRYTTSHPNDMDEELIQLHGTCEKLMPYLHLPVQAGSDRILKIMNRNYTAAQYIEVIARLRAARPNLALSGDFIVGYPGETAADFDATMDLIREVQYAQAYSFKYNARPGTPAADYQDQVPEEEKNTRLQALQALLREQQTTFNQACVGETMPVLFDRPGRQAGQLIGRSPYMQAVHATAPEHWLGKIHDIKVISAAPNSLAAEITDKQGEQAA